MDPTQILIGLLTVAASFGGLWMFVRNLSKRADEERAEMRETLGDQRNETRASLSALAEKVDHLVVLAPTVENHDREILALRDRVHVNGNMMTTLMAKLAEITTQITELATAIAKRRR